MIFKKLRQKRERKIQEKSYAERFDRVLISNKVTHQNIGGKIGYVMREISPKELESEIRNLNFACCNFMKRREDICNNFLNNNILDDVNYFCINEEDGWKKMQDKRRHILKPIVKEQNIKFYYVKVWSNGPFKSDAQADMYGYVIASDEIDKYIKAKDVKEESIWI